MSKSHRRQSLRRAVPDVAVLRSLARDPGEEDGVAPERGDAHDSAPRKTRALCKQVARALRLAFAGDLGDPILQTLDVQGVEPHPDASRLRVVVAHALTGDAPDAELTLQHLDRARGVLRRLVAEAIHRRRTPELLFTWGEAPAPEPAPAPRPPELCQWTVEPPPVDVRRSLDRLLRQPDVAHVAVMPDVHLSGEVCVGTVVATHRTLYPLCLGNDAGCGMLAVPLGGSAGSLRDERVAQRLLAGLAATIPVMKHHRVPPGHLPDALLHPPLSTSGLERQRARDGVAQFATLGRGNHFLEFLADDEDGLWLLVHSGARGMGPAILRHHRGAAGTPAPGRLAGLDAESAAGRAFLADVEWAVDYAAASRAAMARRAVEVAAELMALDPDWTDAVSCTHNFVRREVHFGEELWVHRKGAISARDGERGVIPGSMGCASHLVRGRGLAASLASSSHGAGRVLSRGAAAHRISPRALLRQMRGVWFDTRRVAQLLDEAPEAYRRIGEVMRAQRELCRTERRLRPLLSFKGA